MREIGSEFWNVPTTNTENSIFPDATQWFLSGRSALQAIIKDLKNVKSIAMPLWCCDSIIKPFMDAGIEVCFYPVYVQEKLVQELPLEADAILLMEYFGYSAESPNLKNYDGILIRDVTHSVFTTVFEDADYYFGSLRKWCGVWTGGYAWAKDKAIPLLAAKKEERYIRLREQAMTLKSVYLKGCSNKDENNVNKKGYLEVYDEAENSLEGIGIALAAERDINLARKLDVDFLKTRRRNNAKVLMEAFSKQLLFPELNEDDCPLFVPILVPNGKRDELRNYLIKNDIYCPVHWPASDLYSVDKKTEFLLKNELSLVCDQRYTEEDMFRIVRTIEQFWIDV